MQDTLSFCATNDTIQQIAVILQGIFLAVGAILHLFQKRR
ncbi:MAG: hypothetical protein [Arizlama microvirus]|nr:MAG: hypothetical protein [Arizlama microvirus]